MADKLGTFITDTNADNKYDKLPVALGSVKNIVKETSELLEKYSAKIYELETRIEELEKQLRGN